MCKPDDENELWTKPKNCKDKYQVASGYVRLPGNRCEGGLEKDSDIYLDCKEQDKVMGKVKAKPKTEQQKQKEIEDSIHGGYVLTSVDIADQVVENNRQNKQNKPNNL